ncbi:MAG TPA: Gfo/Idh/MocA family oxidoreductase [Mobilitalea sp.]|nr:Gfo/Idh/MocA family oxidoreductase [Mobilitalea sp.]
MKKIKWGIIGTGRISTKFATALNSMEDTEIAAVASRDIARANEFVKLFAIKKAYSSYEELAKDPEIDVIYIGTPHTEHKANAALCIMNRKAVLCEKPFTLNQQDSKYLIDLAREYDVFLMEAMWTKFLPATKMVKKWIQDKIIGDVKFIRISFGFQSEFDINSRLFNPNLAGGALLDVGIYPIAYAIHMMGKLPDKIVSDAYIGKSGVDEMNTITMLFNEGVIADLSSAITVNSGNDAVIFGNKGKIVVPNFWMAESAEVYDGNDKLVDTFLLTLTSNGYVYEAEEVNQCIREGKKESEIIPLMDTLNIMKIMDGIRNDWGLIYPQERMYDY